MKKKRFVIAMILLCALKASAQQDGSAQSASWQHRLMPVPASIQVQAGRLKIDTSFTVGITDHKDARLEAAIHRAARRLEGRTGYTFSRAPVSDPRTATLVIQCRGAGSAVPSVREDESYSLEVSDQRAILNAATVVGVIRGLETFLQLLEGDRGGYFIPSVVIQDRPRFPWRGLLIDVARHYEPMEVLKRNLDAMAAVKLNV
ncbi:MAG TPA: beta-N-acetylhexosaminidase N-terminal domain-containing protein, partial [Blastocatellia bacterium]|nr:beta-N-acetylhexosaminidase N-terminal domain-containing protein [Blastocatellia bacterium]